ncbi:MAG: tetratricopeptide repeat protein [Phycisphaerales bacterium]
MLVRRVTVTGVLGLGLALLAPLGGCQAVNEALSQEQVASGPRLYDGMGPHNRRVTTTSADAQKYFDQGLNWAFAFNHDEAIRSFQEAARLDPSCAMAWWGIALCNGPHINNPVMDEAHSKAAWDALQKATRLSANGTLAERALIDALRARYADPAAGKLPLTAEERAPLDKAYAAAMKKVWTDHRNDADIASLYAESLMDTRPWDLWDHRTQKPRPETPEVLAALEHALRLNPDHPGANHYYIHAVEASPHPDKATAAADRLRTLMPASGHLVHMPAHIDVRVGRWDRGAEQNRQASKIDTAYRKVSPTQGIYRIYMAHNDHFLAWTCMMLGRQEEANRAASEMVRKIPADFMKDAAPFVDAITPIETEVMVRFGQWDKVLAQPNPPEFLPVTTALWHFARATAHAAKGNLDAAAREQSEFRRVARGIPETTMMAQNPAHKVLAIAEHTLAGEIAFRQGSHDEAVAQLTKAVEIEDDLRYMEPPDWVQPVRHSLGAVLLASGNAEEAEKVYQQDLQKWPGNGWALFGIAECRKARSDPGAAEAMARFERAWRHADTKIHATCLCVPKN